MKNSKLLWFVTLFWIPLQGCSSVAVHDVQWRAPDGFLVSATEYLQKDARVGERGTVVILPPTGGSTILDSKYAKHLCERGAHVLLVQDWSGLNEEGIDFGIHNRLFSYAHRAVGMALEHATGEVKLLGTSLGALYGLSAVARYPQIKRAVLIVGGYSFTDVIATSAYPGMKSLRERREKQFSIADEATYLKQLNGVFTWNDPAIIRSPELDRTKFLLFQGLQDVTVPTATQQNLEHRLPAARVVKLDYGHFWTIVHTYFSHEEEILDFLAGKKE